MRHLLRSPWLAAFLAGAFSALAWAPLHVVPVLWLSFPVLAWLTGRARPARAFALGWVFGLGQFLAGLYWVARSFAVADTGGWAGGAAGVLALTAGLALFPAFAVLLARIAGAGRGRLLAWPLAWVLAEMLRERLFTGLPWNLAGHVWGFSQATLQPVAWIGLHGLGLLTVLAALGPVPALKGKWGTAAVVTLPLLLVLGAGTLRNPAPGTHLDAPVIRVVQGNISQERKMDPEFAAENILTYANLSAGSSAALVVWPETAIPFDPLLEPVRGFLTDTMPPEAWFVSGAFRLEDGRVYNSLFVMDPDGDVAATYDKVRLVPFGEFLPFAERFPRLAAPLGGRGLSGGSQAGSVEVPPVPTFLPRICFEAVFPLDHQPRPKWILNITNDAWFGRTSGPYQHFVQVRMRAAEWGIPVVRAANTGISAVIDSRGAVVDHLPLGVRGILDVPLPASEPPTVYARWVHDASFGFLLLSLVVVFGYSRKWRDERTPSTP